MDLRADRRTLLLIFAFVAIVFILLLVAIFSPRPRSQSAPSTSLLPAVSSPAITKSVAPKALTTYLAEIGADGKPTLTSLPSHGGEKMTHGTFASDVKQLQLLDSKSLFYIANTDIAELGDRIIRRRLSDGAEVVFYEPPEKFYVNSFVISPDRTRMVVWLISPTLDGFKGGLSRLVSFPLPALVTSPVAKDTFTTILSESITSATHYPLFWSKVTKRLYLGTFSPGGAMNQGIFSLEVPISQASLQPELPAGTYGGEVILSPSGRLLAFTRETPSQTSNLPPLGTFLPSTIRNTNAIVVRDLESGLEKIVTESLSGDIFTHPVWTVDESSLIILKSQVIEGKVVPTEFEKYQLTTGNKVALGSNAQGEVIADIGDGVWLLGIRVSPIGAFGSTDGRQTAVYGSFYLLYPDNTYVKVYTDSPAQVVGIF